MAAPSTRHLTQLLSLTSAAGPSPDSARPRTTADPYRLALSVTHADGRITRWGPDEVKPENVSTGLSFGTSIPGGFKDMTCELLRRIDVDYPDEALFDSVRVYGPGNETGWEGRVAQLPRQHGDQFSVQPGAVGWAAHLEDDPSFREIYVDRDLAAWGAPALSQQVVISTVGDRLMDTGSVATDGGGNSALVLSMTRLIAQGLAQAWYGDGDIAIERVYTDMTTDANGGGGFSATWDVIVALSTGENIPDSVVDVSSDLGPSYAGHFATLSTDRAFATVYMIWPSVDVGDGSWKSYWGKLAVYGTHGLTRRGTDPGGFYGSDVIANILRRVAPLLTYSTGADGSISPTSFVIPHLAFKDPVTASDAIGLVNGFHLYEWGVYDGREFFWRPPDSDRLTWEARLSDGAEVSLEGDDANNLFNGVIVAYTDPAGKRYLVGPPGSVTNAWDASLVDTDPDNPVNAHGIPRRWGRLDVSNTTTQAGAIQLGAVWLAEHRLPSRRGQLTLTGLVQHPTQGKRPVWAVRAGDFIRIADRPNDPARRIIETRYDHDTRKLTASLDQTVFKLEALMERMGVSLVGVI